LKEARKSGPGLHAAQGVSVEFSSGRPIPHLAMALPKKMEISVASLKFF
jgi:hypothetical protein